MDRMLRLVSTLFFLFAFLCSACSSNCSLYKKTFSGPELASNISDSTVALIITLNDSARPFCTGVWVSKTMILTANHCVEALAAATSAYRLKKEMSSPDFNLDDFVPTESMGLEIPFTVKADIIDVGVKPTAIYFSKAVALSKSKDLALLRVKTSTIPEHSVAKIADTAPEVGESLAIVGHPGGLYWSYATGIVSAYHNEYSPDDDITGPFMQVSASIYFGNSGGGAFNQSAELVGICSMKLKPDNTNLFIQLKVIQSFLSGYDLYKLRIDTSKSPSTLD